MKKLWFHLKSMRILSVLLIALSSTILNTEASRAEIIENPNNTVGLKLLKPGACDGYTLLAPPTSSEVYLIDMLGREVHRWETEHKRGLVTYLLPNGDLLRAINVANYAKHFPRDGKSGMIQKIDWDGNVLWSFNFYNENHLSHHDIEPMPNGNVLLIAWDRKTETQAIEVGRDPSTLSGYFSPKNNLIGGDSQKQSPSSPTDDSLTTEKYLLPEKIIEIKPIGSSGGEIVWEWHAWDHLVQDFDKSKENYGVVAEHPELININHSSPLSPDKTDWLHVNAIDYNPSLDQIILTCHSFSEIWVIDHSTTTAEAAGHTGGNSGMGGDLIYRWGNPDAYNSGDTADQMLFYPHDAQWIDSGLPGEGHILIFNNGLNRTEQLSYSSVDEIELPIEKHGDYILNPNGNYGPDQLAWSYQAEDPKDFYSRFISSAQRLPNGNTLICSGKGGNLFEITRAGQMVWQYINPIAASGILSQGDEIPVARNMTLNLVFKAHRYPPDYPAFIGKTLTPKTVIEGAASTQINTLRADAPQNLTEAQEQAYSAIIAAFKAKQRAAFQQARGDTSKIVRMMIKLSKERDGQMREILDEQQFKQYKDWAMLQRKQR
jgi:hypothetical protein